MRVGPEREGSRASAQRCVGERLGVESRLSYDKTPPCGAFFRVGTARVPAEPVYRELRGVVVRGCGLDTRASRTLDHLMWPVLDHFT